MPSTPLIIGHRGASRDAPENTLASFRLAFEQEADGIEADFRLTRDGHIVCLHDAAAFRTAGSNLEVAASTLAELQRLDAGIWKGDRWRGERIPALAQVLELLPAGKRLFIELKCGAEILDPLAADLARAGVPADRIRFLAFDHLLVAALKKRLPDYRTCWLCDYRWRGGWHPPAAEVLSRLAGIGADGLASRDRAILDASLVGELRQRGLEIHVWTVDSAKSARRLCDLGVDSIMTNRPGWLRRSLDLPRERA
ncbi:glycerophosphodiester phosphodiesterase [Geomonas subterranea]|uniref:Glycerophosphodiester phosphodiesterase n=2 Tax=Geomonas subterranea TaxID=2847989 RepID=A0ABX8LLL9_9BACT|nr:glycerophosphodiester phosphodiesterase [Geomonas subterranea]QXE92931.1 glycerophosphodiester phosphodiesterase [Geomonas subterranea]QXM08963.1 glycerophosphodiester phosphodiesterase [Geomonas subterranea]